MTRRYEVTILQPQTRWIDATSTEDAGKQAERLAHDLSTGKVAAVVHSVFVEGYVAPHVPTPPHKPWGRPNGGGTPGTPIIRQPALQDQVATERAA